MPMTITESTTVAIGQVFNIDLRKAIDMIQALISLSAFSKSEAQKPR